MTLEEAKELKPGDIIRYDCRESPNSCFQGLDLIVKNVGHGIIDVYPTADIMGKEGKLIYTKTEILMFYTKNLFVKSDIQNIEKNLDLLMERVENISK